MKSELVLEDYTAIRHEWRDNWGEPGQHQIDVQVPAQRYRFTIPKYNINILLRPSRTSEIYAELFVQMLKARKKYFENEDLDRDQKLKYLYFGRVQELNQLLYLRLDEDTLMYPNVKPGDPVGDPVRDAIKRIFPNRENKK